jgi:hypothetical protein
MFSKRIRSSGLSQRFAVVLAVALVVSPLVVEANPAAGSGPVEAEVVNVDFTTATQTGSTIANPASGRVADLTVSGSPTGLTTADGLQFANISGSSRDQYLTGNLGTTINMSQIVIEFEGRFPDAGCDAYNAGSMVFSLGSSNSSFVNYNIYRHSGFIGFNTFNSEIFGISLPSTTSVHRYKFLMVPNSQSRTAQRIWVDGVEQSLAFRTSPSESAGCSALSGSSEQSSGRVFSSGGYSDGRFMFMTHALGASTWSTTGTIKNLKITTTSIPASVPGAPSISAITAGNGQLSVAFTAPASNGGAAISNYEYSTDNGSSWTTRSPSSTSSPIVIPTLNNGTSYQVRIRAVNDVGSGAQSSAVTGTPVAPSSTPGAPTISSITAGDTQLSVAFSAPSSDGGAAITNYDYSTDNGGIWVTPSTPATSSPLVVTGLTNGTSYQIKIRARNSVGPGTASNAVTGTPAAPTPAPVPPSTSSAPVVPPTPPASKVSAISVKPSNSSRGSMLTLKLNEPPVGLEKVTVVVRLLDLNGKLIQELTIPVSSTTSSLEVPVNLPIGTFTVSAGTSNSSASSQAMTLQADTVKKSWLASPSPEGTLRLAGKAASDPIYFSPNSVSLSKQARSELRQAAKVAKRTNSRVAVTGFSAASGMGTVFEKNIAERRALAVTKFLKAQGVSSWLFFSGFDGAKTAEFSGQPRRVEIRILK